MTQPAPQAQKRDSTAVALVWAAAIACTLTAGTLLSAGGSGTLQQALRTLGFGRQSAIEARQDQQALAISGIERMIQNIGREVGALNTRMSVSEHKETIASERLARLDGDLTALRDEIAAARAMRHDMLRLRSTIDANDQAQRKSINSLTKRLDRLEQAIGRDLTASTGQANPAAKATKRRERAPEPDPIADAMTELMILHGTPNGVEGPSGHVIDTPHVGH